MKENKEWSTEEKWTSITTALKAASDAGTWAFWRERFNTNHPDHIRNEEIENPTQFAYANWIAAKHVYCKSKDEMDKHCHYLTHECDPYPGISQQVEFFMAMKSVVDKEMEVEMEKVLLDEVEELEQEPTEELDEDEQYVRETEGTWEGDEYVGIGDDEELEDLDLIDEE